MLAAVLREGDWPPRQVGLTEVVAEVVGHLAWHAHRMEYLEYLADEVVQTLAAPTPERVEEELTAVGLMGYVRDFLPTDWKTAFCSPQRSELHFS